MVYHNIPPSLPHLSSPPLPPSLTPSSPFFTSPPSLSHSLPPFFTSPPSLLHLPSLPPSLTSLHLPSLPPSTIVYHTYGEKICRGLKFGKLASSLKLANFNSSPNFPPFYIHYHVIYAIYLCMVLRKYLKKI